MSRSVTGWLRSIGHQYLAPVWSEALVTKDARDDRFA